MHVHVHDCKKKMEYMYITGYLQKIKSIQWVLTNRFTFRTYHMSSFFFFFERGDILIFKINQNMHELKIGFNTSQI